MGSMKKWILGAALAMGALAMSATPAQAARFGVYVGGPAVAVPACPGPDYAWVAGYWNAGIWVPGYWHYAGVGSRIMVRGGFLGHGPVFYRGGFYRHYGFRR